MNATWRPRVAACLDTVVRWPQKREHANDKESRTHTVDLSVLAAEYWARRLGLSADAKLHRDDLLDLSFSVLGDEQRRLHRFRAVTSLCRAMAALVAVAFWGLLVLLLFRVWPTTLWGISTVIALLIAYHCFAERFGMYERLWNAIIHPQFLANSSSVNGARSGLPTTTSLQPPASSRGVKVPAIVSHDVAPSNPPIPLDAQGTAPSTEDGGLLA
jgi:hypothetical protein